MLMASELLLGKPVGFSWPGGTSESLCPPRKSVKGTGFTGVPFFTTPPSHPRKQISVGVTCCANGSVSERNLPQTLPSQQQSPQIASSSKKKAIDEEIERRAAESAVNVLHAHSVRNALFDKPAGPVGTAGLKQLRDLTAAGNNRREKIVAAIESWNKPLHPGLREQKYKKMAESPFALFRGTAHLFWADFSGDWRLCRFGNPKTRTWLLGDMHVYNFGAFYNQKSQLCYGLNDFDEAIIGDYQYDLWRLATSMVLIMKANGELSLLEQEHVILALASSYLQAVVTYKRTPEGQTFTKQNTYGKLSEFLQIVEQNLGPEKMLAKWCVRDKNGALVGFNYEMKEKLVRCTDAEREGILSALPAYRTNLKPRTHPHDLTAEWHVKDIARRISSGLGSLGVPRYYLLVEVDNKQVVILDVKRQTKPAAYFHMSAAEQQEYNQLFSNDGQRHAAAAAALTVHTDAFNGWMQVGSLHFSVREISPYKQAFPALKKEARKAYKELSLCSERRFVKMAEQWGTILATKHAHARHDFDGAMGRFHFRTELDSLTIGRREEFCHLVWQVARDYAMQVDWDWRYFMDRLFPDDAVLADKI